MKIKIINELNDSRLSEIRQRIRDGFYSSRRVIEKIAEKVLKDVVSEKKKGGAVAQPGRAHDWQS